MCTHVHAQTLQHERRKALKCKPLAQLHCMLQQPAQMMHMGCDQCQNQICHNRGTFGSKMHIYYNREYTLYKQTSNGEYTKHCT